MTITRTEWAATMRIETWNVSGSRRPGAGTSELVMEVGGEIFTRAEWDRGTPASALRYRRLPDGCITSHGQLLQGFAYGADENVSDWSR